MLNLEDAHGQGGSRLLQAWNATRADFPQVCAHELFERQVVRSPDAVAVVSGERLTYRELNERANRIAHHLGRRGVGRETLVGVCLERSPDMVAALLGVWKAGGAYVPLDPAYPPDRLSFMVEDADVRVLIADRTTRPLFASADDRVFDLAAARPLIAEESPDDPAVGATLSDLAYVMYTSGSTGRPKGAMILHGGLVNYLAWAIREYAVGPDGGAVPVHSSISFDLTVTSLYPALLTGGQVELLPDDPGAQGLIAALRRAGDRTLVKITPAHLEILSRELDPGEAAGLVRAFVIGGENLTAESLRFWRRHAPAARLINEYGPTETVVGCCTYEVRAGDPDEGSVPIGRPIANTQLHVLDPDLRPAAPGVVGELYIGGAGVARGYLNRPELTRERFLPDPFSGEAGGRMYRTGDLARYRDDGILEYLGRVDDQVKVRGYRIELGEIEQTLMGHPGVRSCVVVAREDAPGDRQLAAYVIPHENGLAIQDLREFLKARLPEYMVPARFALVDAFPLTRNGKVDRRALPPPPPEAATSAEEPAELRSETEKAVAGIWAKLLNRERVGLNEDVFDLGANSLLAMRALSRIRELFGVHVPTRNLFEAPTVAGLAAVIDRLAWAGQARAPEDESDREEIEL
ncbi:MAG TPA: non-ribosomal peptide synthetase [Beijerinckiaceae bacterium]|jgi:amino acid adenylation domain-containing protein